MATHAKATLGCPIVSPSWTRSKYGEIAQPEGVAFTLAGSLASSLDFRKAGLASRLILVELGHGLLMSV